MTFRVLADGLAFPEGPVVMEDGSVLVVEIASGNLTRVSARGEKEVVAHLGGGPNGAALGPDGFYYVCNNGGFTWHKDELGLRPTLQAADYAGGRIERVNLDTGRFERVYDSTPEGPLRGPNDLVFDRHGGFWFTDTGKGRARTFDRGGFYDAKPDVSVIRQVIYPMILANGVGLSPSGDTLYVAESPTGRVWQFDITGPGEIRAAPWPSPHGGTLLARLPGYQLCDSLAVQANGCVCVATLINGGISVIDPGDGAVRHVPLPDIYTTNIAFGGPDLRTAYITLSFSGLLIAMDWDSPGLALEGPGRR